MPLGVLVFPEVHDGLDGVLGHGPARVAVDAERRLLHRRGPARAPLDAALGEHVDRRNLLGHAHRRCEPVRHQADAEAQADVLGDLAQGAEHDVGCRAVGAALTEVVLDQPDRVEAELVGQLDLLEGLVVGLLLGLALVLRELAGPGAGNVDLVEQVQLQGVGPPFVYTND